MSHFLTIDMANKIADAQKNLLTQCCYRASVEWNYLIVEFQNQLHAQFENILKDPFNVYIKILVKDDCNEKNFITKLNELYSREFQHSLKIVDGHYYILLQSPHFSSPDNRPQPVSKISCSEIIEPEKSYVFSESEKKAFIQREEYERTPRLGYDGEFHSASGEKKNLPTLLLQRRNSRMSLPTISARGIKTSDQEFSTVETSLSTT